MTYTFDPTRHQFNAGKRLFTLEDFQQLHRGSVILNFGRPGNVYPEVLQKKGENSWNSPGHDKVELPYSDRALSEGVEDTGEIYVLAYQAPDTVKI